MSLSFPPQRKPRRRNGKDLISCLDHPWLKGVKLPWWSKMPAAQQRKALHSAEPPSLGKECECAPHQGKIQGPHPCKIISDSLGGTQASKIESKHLSQQHTSPVWPLLNSCAAP